MLSTTLPLAALLTWSLSKLAIVLERDERRRRRLARIRLLQQQRLERELAYPMPALKDFIVKGPARVITAGPVLVLAPEPVDALVIRTLRETRALAPAGGARLVAHNGSTVTH
jgi:hypothetical protein